MTTRPIWPPSEPSGGYYHPDNNDVQEQLDEALPDQSPACQVIGEMARLLRSTRGNMLTGAGILTAVMIGAASQAGLWAKATQPGMAGVIGIGLLCGLAFSWLTAAALLVLAGRPVLNALSELRWRTGAPLDPRAPWLTLPPAETNRDEWTWIRAHLLLGAARLARHRIQLADTWTYVTAAFFLLCTGAFIFGR